ncbi:MAG: magnesium chelatase subunit H [Clostridia bacterium]|nr:magnesium chelatase subunit H [Clostridia bacterium]
MKLVVITVSNVVLSAMVNCISEIEKRWPDICKLSLFAADKNLPEEKLKVIKERIKNADMIILDLMGSPEKLQECVIEACKSTQGHIVPIGGENSGIRSLLKLGSLRAEDVGGGIERQNGEKPVKPMNPEAMQKMMNMAQIVGKAIPFGKPRDMSNYVTIGKYWRAAGQNDIRNLLYFLFREYGQAKGIPEPQEPGIIEETSICRPYDMKYYDSFEKYTKENGFDNQKPIVALLYYGHNYPNKTSGCVSKIAEKIKAFANVLPIAFATATGRNQERLRKILNGAAGRKVDIIINFMSFRLGAGPMGGDADSAVNMLKDLDVPILHPFFMSRREEDEWINSPQGTTPSEFLISVMLPELDGCIETFPVGAMKKASRNETYNVEISELEIIEERADKLAARVRNWLKLREKPASEKKAAIICYNYPPGEDNLFGGAFLDTFASVETLQKCLIDNGYTLELKKAEELMQIFTAGRIVNSGRWAAEECSKHMLSYDKNKYLQAFENMPMSKEIIRQWGQLPGEIMTEGNSFLIPGIINGNIFIGLQPSRGIHENPEKVYHDKTLLPHHQYNAFYNWLKEEFKADIIIHVGTHGTLEFLKGKECGMSGECFPDILVSDIPHAYIYYSGNPSEAMIAKRRSHAVLVGYQPPVFMEGELYGELSYLQILINELNEAKNLDPLRCKDIEEKIKELAEKINLGGYSLPELERELYRMKRSLVPKGLHVFGKGYSKEEAFEFTKFVLRYDRGEIKAPKRILAEHKGMDYEALLEKNDVSELLKLDLEAEELLDEFLKTSKLPDIQGMNPNHYKQLKAALEYGERVYKNVQECHELKGFQKVLSGQYLSARLAGDMIRNPEILPSGYNLYQFDPRLVPGEAAAERGARIAENTLEQYKREHGEYPKSTAVILWGLETSRTQGETVGQILYYLGVRVKNRRNLFQPHYEIIPIEELGRPRIDVVINICGFFRDMFPNLIDDLNGVFIKVARLNEPDHLNYFRANSFNIFKKLVEEGIDEEEAHELSVARLFGPAEAEYGTGITRMFETKNWTEETQIGEAFIKSLKHVYSKNYRGRAAEDLLNTHLKAVEIVSQIRSSHEYEVTDLDHYYEFFGGLSKSVELVKGKKAVVYISDTTGERAETETVDKAIARGVRTRILNPKWIDSMLEHKYHGVQKISDRFENILGLAATTNKVDSWVFSSLHSVYVSDEKMRERMKENNRWAYFSMLETLLESNSRGYWKASKEEMEELMRVYLALEGDNEENSDKMR